ncbi:hypothetical protein KG112_15405 [Nocardioides sp. zg-ZUI104]|uniref:hypothetical protein n=1 Tax=Nocardioides faecalis TaxID=2803858 RepID=UPI001BD0053E|nr:hypothetical protein [Nocardioides faecalis]MBS4754195.1 hypothetical protein [Nocardioides faecalis]
MSLPEQPATFRPASQPERPWRWRLEDGAGTEVVLDGDAATEYGEQAFANQGDAESWIGEIWAELAELGVAQVTLFEVDREVYGPMSLSV